MSDSGAFVRQLSEAARALQHESGTQPTLDKGVKVAMEIVEGCELAGISVMHPDRIDTPAGSEEALMKLDALQYEIGEGPCLDALREHETVNSRDLSKDQRWPEWGSRVAEELGVRSVLSYRLFTTNDTLGALNLYSRSRDAFDSEDVYNGLALAAHLAVALAAELNADHLHIAINNRTVIGQAEGILMERHGLSADRAFEVLRRVSSHRNVKLSRVAAELVKTREIPR